MIVREKRVLTCPEIFATVAKASRPIRLWDTKDVHFLHYTIPKCTLFFYGPLEEVI